MGCTGNGIVLHATSSHCTMYTCTTLHIFSLYNVHIHCAVQYTLTVLHNVHVHRAVQCIHSPWCTIYDVHVSLYVEITRIMGRWTQSLLTATDNSPIIAHLHSHCVEPVMYWSEWASVTNITLIMVSSTNRVYVQHITCKYIVWSTQESWINWIL